MKSHLTGLGLIAVGVAILAGSAFAAEPTKDTLATVKKSVSEENAVLVDVREKSEWDDGHISGAVFLSLRVLHNGITADALAKRLPKDQIIYTHCAVGVRSCTPTDIMLKHGYDVRPMKPSYKALIAAGFKKAEKKAEK